MTTVKAGHQAIHSSLRPAEVDLLGELTSGVNEVRRSRKWPGPDIKRAGVIRAAVRYVLEHREDFIIWLNDEYTKRGQRDAE